jgi:phospholipid transport system substrate-binding protein
MTSVAAADDKTEVSTLLQTNVDAIVLLLQNNGLDKGERNAKIIDIVTPLFNYQTMAKLSLGKKHWPSLDAEQKAEFSKLFTKLLQDSYLEKLDIYTDEKVLYGEPQTVGKKIHAPTTLIAKDSRIEILYKFYKSAKGWMIYDVEIGGVSVIQTYRSQFDGVLSKGTTEDLLEKLRTEDSFSIPEPDPIGG